MKRNLLHGLSTIMLYVEKIPSINVKKIHTNLVVYLPSGHY